MIENYRIVWKIKLRNDRKQIGVKYFDGIVVIQAKKQDDYLIPFYKYYDTRVGTHNLQTG